MGPIVTFSHRDLRTAVSLDRSSPLDLRPPGRSQLAKTLPSSTIEISLFGNRPSTLPDHRSSAEVPHAAIHRRVRPNAQEEETCLQQSCDTRWRGSVR